MSRSVDPSKRLWVRIGSTPVWEQLSGLSAVFDPFNGETHFLSELPALLLSHLGSEAVTFSTLMDRVAGPVDLEDSAECKVLATLVYLEGAELVESRAP